jgi:tetratricopeptide (TPR) repeat protein
MGQWVCFWTSVTVAMAIVAVTGAQPLLELPISVDGNSHIVQFGGKADSVDVAQSVVAKFGLQPDAVKTIAVEVRRLQKNTKKNPEILAPPALQGGKNRPGPTIPAPHSTETTDLHIIEGNAMFAAGSFAKAEKKYRQAISIQPTNQKALLNLGVALFSQGRWDDSITMLESGAAAHPSYAGLHSTFGLLLAKRAASATGNDQSIFQDKALFHYGKALQLLPTDLVPYLLVSRCWHPWCRAKRNAVVFVCLLL